MEIKAKKKTKGLKLKSTILNPKTKYYRDYNIQLILNRCENLISIPETGEKTVIIYIKLAI